MFSKVTQGKKSVLHVASLELAKEKKSLSDGTENVHCWNATGTSVAKIAEKFKSVLLSHQNVQRKVTDVGQQVTKTMREQVMKAMSGMAQCCSSFLCLDKSIDQKDVSQLLMLTCMTLEDFFLQEKNY